jgi:hypothetical protein
MDANNGLSTQDVGMNKNDDRYRKTGSLFSQQLSWQDVGAITGVCGVF